jgi:uncharacterized protein (DUF1778 family)
MPKTSSPADGAKSSLMVRLDESAKNALVQAAQLRQMSVSDYVRTVTVGQARREIAAAQTQTLALTADEQLALWTALSQPAKLTARQKQLGKLMRGEA